VKTKAICIVCVLFAIAAGWFAGEGPRLTSAADPPRAAAPEGGRYQLLQDRNGNPAYLFDSGSGQVWEATNALKPEWVEHIDPPKKK
jgi:hypothetical protein